MDLSSFSDHVQLEKKLFQLSVFVQYDIPQLKNTHNKL